MKIAIGCDHAAFALKEIAINQIIKNGHKTLDLGTDTDKKPEDYPEFIAAVARAVWERKTDRSVVIFRGGGASCKINHSTAHEAKRLELDSSKAKRQLGWNPKWRLETAVEKTVSWAKASRTKQGMLAYSLSQIAGYETL